VAGRCAITGACSAHRALKRARTGDPQAPGRRPLQPGDRATPLPLGGNGQSTPQAHLRQARRTQSHRGGSPCPPVGVAVARQVGPVQFLPRLRDTPILEYLLWEMTLPLPRRYGDTEGINGMRLRDLGVLLDRGPSDRSGWAHPMRTREGG